MRALYDTTYKGEEETEESDTGLLILSKAIFGINGFLFKQDDNRPVHVYNEEGQIDAIAEYKASLEQEKMENR